MASPPSIREAVLAWMRENGAGPTEAARKFDLPVSRVKQWSSRDRHKQGDGDTKPGDGDVSRPVTSRARGKPSLADVRPDDRTRILGFKDKVLDHLNSDELLKDTRKARDLVGALVQLASSIPDLLTLDERMKAVEAAGGSGLGADGGEAAASRVHAALEGAGSTDPS